MFKDTIFNKTCEDMSDISNKSVDCIVTSPPYFNLRDYNIEGQIGLELTMNDYIKRLCNVFNEGKRVLKKEGSCWVNLGDSYSGSGVKQTKGLKTKSLCMIPQRFALEMINRGWILRNTIIWHKLNAMPSSATDRFTVDFEYLYFFVKSNKYYFDTQYEPLAEASIKRNQYGHSGGGDYAMNRKRNPGEFGDEEKGRIKRTVWKINTQSTKGTHYATFPEKLIETPIKAGCPKGGIVLDPFMGSGTTALIAKQLNRNFIGYELNLDYIENDMKKKLKNYKFNVIKQDTIIPKIDKKEKINKTDIWNF